MEKETVLGVIFLDGFLKYLGENPNMEMVKLFHAGFVMGQAEKVASGACYGAMFRTGEKYQEMCVEVDTDIAHRYGLRCVTIGEEIWIVNNTGNALLVEMCKREENSPTWHLIRGIICGFPPERIDYTYHMRKGYLEPADR